MLSSYRTLLARPGARRLVLVCALGWLAFCGYGLAVILAVHHATHSYATAGATVATQSIGAGLLAPVRGRLVDRHGPRALRVFAVTHALSGALLTLALVARSTPGAFAGAALLGLSVPPLIATARTQWTHVAGPELVRTGHALNAALSDAAQIAMPATVAGIALATSPVVTIPLLVAAATAGALLLSALTPPSPERVSHDRPPDGWRPIGWLLGALRESRGLRVLAACDLLTAGWLSGLEIAVIALAGRHGSPELGALTLAACAMGSIVVSLVAGAGVIGGAPTARYRAGMVLAAPAVALTLLTTQPALLAPILVAIGAAFGLINVAFYELVDVVSPPGRTTEAFTWLTTASSTGAALGAVVCGRLVTAGVRAPALFITTVAVAAALLALQRARALQPAAVGAQVAADPD